MIDAVGGEGSAIDTGENAGDPGSYNFPPAPQQQLASMVAGYAFMDSQHRYTQTQCRLLLRMLRHNVRTSGQDDRPRWFLDVRKCRRRAQGRLDLMRKGGVEQVRLLFTPSTRTFYSHPRRRAGAFGARRGAHHRAGPPQHL